MQKLIIRLLSTLFPTVIANFAYKKLTSPQIMKLRDHELRVLDKADKEKIDFLGFDIQTYKWGDAKNEKILLIHGWEGQAGNFAEIIERLIDHNYHVIAFDGPSHGFSSKGPTSMFEFCDLVEILIKKYQCKKLISHSFGGVATTYALRNIREIKIEKYLLLTTPDKFSERIDDVASSVGVTDKVKNILIKRIEKETDLDVKSMNVSDNVKNINVAEALIIHDKNDKVIPIYQSKNVYQNWDNCEFKEIEGTGHFRILRTEKVIDDIINFMN